MEIMCSILECAMALSFLCGFFFLRRKVKGHFRIIIVGDTQRHSAIVESGMHGCLKYTYIKGGSKLSKRIPLPCIVARFHEAHQAIKNCVGISIDDTLPQWKKFQSSNIYRKRSIESVRTKVFNRKGSIKAFNQKHSSSIKSIRV